MSVGNAIRLFFSGDTSDLDQATDHAGSSIDRMIKGISAKSAAAVAAGGALAAGLGKAFVDSLDVQDAQAKFAAQLGGNEQYAKDMGAIAGKVYAGAYGENLGQVNDALRSVIQSGALMEDATDEQLQHITENALSLSSAFDLDVKQAMTAVGQVMRNGLAPDAQTAMDVITRGFQQGVDKSEDYLDTLNEYGTQFRQLGLDVASATGLMSQGLQAGARDADTVADALKEFAIRAIDGSKTSADAYAAIGLSAKDMTAQIAKGGPDAAAGLDTVLDRLRAMTDPVAQNAAAVGLFGTKAEDLGQALYALDPSSAVAALGTVEGAADKVNQTLGETASAKLEAAKRGFEQFTQSIVGINGPVGTVAAGVMTFGSDALSMAGSIGMAGMALQSFGVVSKLAAAGQWLLNVALSANPIGLVVIAIAALIAGLVWAYNNVGWFKDGVDAAFSFIGDVISGAVEWFGNLMTSIGDFFAGIDLESLGASIGDFFANLPGMIGDGLLALGAMIFTFFTETLPNGIFFALGYLGGLVYTGALAAWDFLWNTLPGVLDTAVQWLLSLPGMALEAMTAFGTWLGDVSAQAWDLFLQWAITKTAELMAWVETIPGAVGGFLAALPGIVGQAALDAWTGFLNWTVSTGNAALDWIGGVPGSIGNFFAGAGDWLVNAGRMILEGLWNGLKSVAQGVLDWISNIGAQIANGFAAAVGIHSPSKVFAAFGVNIGEGLIQGGEKVTPKVLDSYSGLSSAVVSSMEGMSGPAVPGGGTGGSGTGGGGAVVTFAGNLSDALAMLIMQMIRTGKIQIKGVNA